MIARLSGSLISKKPTSIIIDVGGVGYRVFISLTTFYVLPEEGSSTALNIYTSVREDAIYLFGFATQLEKDVFEKLISVSKIGPKLAIAILSGMAPEDLVETVQRKDIARLSTIPGVGKKTAERLTVELADKFAVMDISIEPESGVSMPTEVYDDAVSALVSLGYKKQEAYNALKKVRAKNQNLDLETTLKEALRLISG